MRNISHHVCGVIPPHILTKMAEQTEHEAGDDARSTLEHMRELATERVRTFMEGGAPAATAAAPLKKRRNVYDAQHSHKFPGKLVEYQGAKVEQFSFTTEQQARDVERTLQAAAQGELTVLTHLLDEICSTDRRARDFTRNALADAIRETIACFPVYRTYVDARGQLTERDRAYINEASVRARRAGTSTGTW